MYLMCVSFFSPKEEDLKQLSVCNSRFLVLAVVWEKVLGICVLIRQGTLWRSKSLWLADRREGDKRPDMKRKRPRSFWGRKTLQCPQPGGPQGRGCGENWRAFARVGHALCTAASIILKWKEQRVDEQGKDDKMDFEQVLGTKESLRGKERRF